MNTSSNKPQTGKAWLTAAIIAALGGGIITVIFVIWWFTEVGGHCGVVRGYEQLFGIILIAGWLAGTIAGLLIAYVSRHRNIKAVVVGACAVILTNIVVVGVCGMVVHSVREADYTRKSPQQLLEFLAGDNHDARILAAHALGEQRIGAALPSLCTILDDPGEDINLRHNAATALGKICAPPRPAGIDLNPALTSLTGALKGREEYLPHPIAQALGEIGDDRAVGPLAEFLSDSSRPIHAREEAARALGRIGGEKAHTALRLALFTATDESLARTIRIAIGEH